MIERENFSSLPCMHVLVSYDQETIHQEQKEE
jgi:hypothetical protein